jgi:2-polyprenyl-6-methoxyphenol hydroxylase-like FAD-dependent oxidoreductase
MTAGTFDICVAGGGPAGAATALRLAQLGKRVALCEMATFPRSHVGEALPASILPLLSVLGARESVLRAGAAPSAFTTVAWAGETARYAVHGGPGLVVERAVFDAALLGDAAAAGVTLFQPARVVRAVADSEPRGWTLALSTGETLQARWLVDATGRGRLLPRRRHALGAKTLGIFAYFRGVRACELGDTFVEAGDDAWYWGALLPNGAFNATVFVAPNRGPDAFDALLARSRLLGPRLAGAQRCSDRHVCDATPYLDLEPAPEGALKVGDAALSLDPVSSQGVQTALGTGVHAAVVLNTLLDRPEHGAFARAFFRQRLSSSATFHQAAASDFYGRQAALAPTAFWTERAGAFRRPTASDTPGELSPDTPVRLSIGVRFTPVPVATEAYVLPTEGLVFAGEPYAFVGRNVALAPLLRSIGDATRASDVVRAWSGRMRAEDALRVLQWVWRRGLLVAAAGAP